jgi:hypothetical protein
LKDVQRRGAWLPRGEPKPPKGGLDLNERKEEG